MLGDNVIGISIISVLLSRYDNNHDNYMKGVMNIKQYKKSVYLNIMENAFSFAGSNQLSVPKTP